MALSLCMMLIVLLPSAQALADAWGSPCPVEQSRANRSAQEMSCCPSELTKTPAKGESVTQAVLFDGFEPFWVAGAQSGCAASDAAQSCCAGCDCFFDQVFFEQNSIQSNTEKNNCKPVGVVT